MIGILWTALVLWTTCIIFILLIGLHLLLIPNFLVIILLIWLCFSVVFMIAFLIHILVIVVLLLMIIDMCAMFILIGDLIVVLISEIAASLVLPRSPNATREWWMLITIHWRQIPVFKLALWVCAVYTFPTPPIAFGGIFVVHWHVGYWGIFPDCFWLVFPLFVGHVPY